MATVKEFKNSFHSLEGKTIADRRKHLFYLLDKISNVLQPDIIDNLIDSIEPNNYLEELYKLEMLIYFRKKSCLLEVLKGENTYFIKKVLKLYWFFDETFKNITGDQLVHDIFSHTSYTTRSKIIHKLYLHIQQEDVAESIFNAICKKYGFCAASNVLPACSKDFIITTITNYKVHIGCRQLLHIYKKYPEAVLFYFELQKKYLINNYTNVLTYIAKQDTTLFLNLLKKYRPFVKLGRRLTKWIIANKKESVVENGKDYLRILNTRYLCSHLKEDFSEFYFNLFPKSINDFPADFENSGRKNINVHYGYLFSSLQHLSTNSQLECLLKSFCKAYNTSLFDHPELVTSQVVKLLKPEDREKWVYLKCKSGEKEEKWIYFLKPEECFPRIKKMISVTSDRNFRSKLIEVLVKCCSINNDSNALLDVCKYVYYRHKNDDVLIRRNFLDTVLEEFEVFKLEEEHWKYINKLTQIFEYNKEFFYDLTGYTEKFVEFRLRNNFPVRDQLKSFAESLLKCHRKMNIIVYNSSYEKICLLLFYEIIPEIYVNENIISVDMLWLDALLSWNKRHAKEELCIFSFPRVVTNLKLEMLAKDFSYSVENTIRYCLHSRYHGQDKYELFKLFWRNCERYLVPSTLCLFLKKEPEQITENLELIMKHAQVTYACTYHFWNLCKNFSHIQIPEKIVDIGVRMLQEEIGEKERLIIILSIVMKSDVFMDLMIPYLPTQSRVDVKNEDCRIIFPYQKALAFSLKHLQPPSLAIKSIMHFCKGDYLKLALSSLYRLSHNVSEKIIIRFLKSNLDTPVSIRKHLIFLIFKILSTHNIFHVIGELEKVENNPSILKFLFRKTFKYFIDNPDDEIWKLLKRRIETIDVNDSEEFDLLIQINLVNSKYVPQFVSFAWKTLGKLHAKGGKVFTLQYKFLDAVNEDVIPSLPGEFCKNIIIVNNFTHENSYVQHAAINFTVKCLLCSFSPIMQELSLIVFNHIKESLIITTKTHERNCVTRNLHLFFTKLCQESCRKGIQSTDLFQKFEKYWTEIAKPYEAFNINLLLHLTHIYLDSLNEVQCVIHSGKLVGHYFDQVIDSFGVLAVPLFCDTLTNFLNFGCSILSESEENIYEFIESVFETRCSTDKVILVIHLLSSFVPIQETSKSVYDRINQKIDDTVPILSIYIKSKLNIT